jgi:hypothetical protein
MSLGGLELAMSESEAPTRHLRRTTGYLVAAGALAVLGGSGFNANMMVLLVAVPAFLATLLSLIRNGFLSGPGEPRASEILVLSSQRLRSRP